MTTKTGNRQRLPENALRACPSCGTPRGNARREWSPITSTDGQVIGYTCGECPTWHEPIRREGVGPINPDSGKPEPYGRFLAVVGVKGPDGTRQQHKRRFDALADAREFVAEVRGGKVQRRPDVVTFRELAESWIASKTGVRQVTREGYEQVLKSVHQRIGDRDVTTLTEDDMTALMAWLATEGGLRGKGLGHRSLSYTLMTVRAVLKFGIRRKLLAENVAAFTELPQPDVDDETDDDAEAITWAAREYVTFRDAADADHLGYAWRLTLCGLRRSEVLGLTWPDVDLEAGTVKVRRSRVTVRGGQTTTGATKTRKSRRDPAKRTVRVERMSPGTAAMLKRAWIAQGQPSSGLVVRDEAGQPVRPDAYGRRFRALAASAKVTVIRLHSVRHTLATLYHAAGHPPANVALILGHSVETHLRVYLRTDPESVESTEDALPEVLAVTAA